MEAEVTIEQLDKSLKALVDSADALAKGGVENSGTTSDGKPAGGGQATTKDAGGIDDMMIAKMSSAGVPADTLAAFQAFMSGKPFEGKEDENEDDDEDEETEKSNKQKPSLAKSARQRFGDDPSIAQAVEVSPYLDALATQTAEAIDALDTSIAKSLGDITKRNDRISFALVKSLTQVATTLRGHGEVLSALAKRLGVIEQAPARAPKGATGTASPIAKSGFGNGNGGGDALTRRELCNTLTFMNLEKGLKTINGFKTSELAVAAEAGGVVAAETLDAVQRFLREHPAEAEKAKAYA